MYASLRSSRVLALILLLFVLAVLLLSQNRSPSTAPISKWLGEGSPHVTEGRLPPGVTPGFDPIEAEASEAKKHESACDTYPDPGNVAIAVKTGATEAVEKIPIMMLTSLQCARNVEIFSDLEQDIAGYHLQDSLKDIPESAMEGNTDFDFYQHLKEAKRYGEIELMLKDAQDPRTPDDLAAWTLDKYKQLHILEKLYAAHPDADWYLMIDADTYLVWSNFLAWLKRLPNPARNKLYLGSTAQVNGVKFAHGGSGILLSRATMFEFAVTNKGVAADWDVKMHEECCGDYIIGKVLKDNGIELKQSWPTINGEKPSTLPFGPKHWCEPVVTMHHVKPNEMSQIANFERSRNATDGLLTFADLYNSFTKDVIPDHLVNWDNYPKEKVFEVDSYESCELSCQEDAECFQFTHHGNECTIDYSVHLGEPKPPEGDTTWRSGWMRERIKGWVDKQKPCRPKFPWT